MSRSGGWVGAKLRRRTTYSLSGIVLVCHCLLGRLESGPVSLFPLAELIEDVIFVCFLMILSNPGLCGSWIGLLTD